MPLLAIVAKVLHLNRAGFVAAFWSYQPCGCSEQTPPELSPSHMFCIQDCSLLYYHFIHLVLLPNVVHFLNQTHANLIPLRKYLEKYATVCLF